MTCLQPICVVQVQGDLRWSSTFSSELEKLQLRQACSLLKTEGSWLIPPQAEIKIAGRNINNLRYADDTTLMAESEELQSLLMKVKEDNGKVGLKRNIQKTKIMASGPITSWQIDGETVETVADYFGGLQNHCRW